MNTVKIFYMALAKENIPIYGVVRILLFKNSIAAKNIGRIYHKGKRCREGPSQDSFGNVAHH
jgi:hypothetical protein